MQTSPASWPAHAVALIGTVWHFAAVAAVGMGYPAGSVVSGVFGAAMGIDVKSRPPSPGPPMSITPASPAGAVPPTGTEQIADTQTVFVALCWQSSSDWQSCCCPSAQEVAQLGVPMAAPPSPTVWQQAIGSHATDPLHAPAEGALVAPASGEPLELFPFPVEVLPPGAFPAGGVPPVLDDEGADASGNELEGELGGPLEPPPAALGGPPDWPEQAIAAMSVKNGSGERHCRTFAMGEVTSRRRLRFAHRAGTPLIPSTWPTAGPPMERNALDDLLRRRWDVGRHIFPLRWFSHRSLSAPGAQRFELLVNQAGVGRSP